MLINCEAAKVGSPTPPLNSISGTCPKLPLIAVRRSQIIIEDQSQPTRWLSRGG